jgi:hypothetical protein
MTDDASGMEFYVKDVAGHSYERFVSKFFIMARGFTDEGDASCERAYSWNEYRFK